MQEARSRIHVASRQDSVECSLAHKWYSMHHAKARKSATEPRDTGGEERRLRVSPGTREDERDRHTVELLSGVVVHRQEHPWNITIRE